MLTVEVLRGDIVESVHQVRACAVRLDGESNSNAVVGEAEAGDSEWSLFLRSAAKPFQAAPAVAAGVVEELGLTDEHLAVACASHDGSSYPTGLVRDILRAAKLDEFSVHTGDDGQGGLVKHQCSGNHALALAFSVVAGWPIDGYLERDHPVQRAMNDAVAAACGTIPQLAADNCGMTTHRVPMSAMARAFAVLGAGGPTAAAKVPGLDRVATAMASHPYAVRQRGQIDSELIARTDGRLVSKVAAEAGVGIGHRDGIGIAVRVVDGNPRAWGVAAMAAVRRWLDEPTDDPVLDALASPPLLDGAARPIGSLRAVWR